MNRNRNRIKKEIDALHKNNDEQISLIVNPENMFFWYGVIKGPPDSIYEGFKFELDIKINDDYPLTPPNIKFITKIFHPNVLFDTGEICLDVLKKEWSPAWDIQSACRAILSLLAEPAADSPLNCDAGNMIRENDIIAFKSTAKMYCIEFAVPC